MIDQRISKFMSRGVLRGDPDTPLGTAIERKDSGTFRSSTTRVDGRASSTWWPSATRPYGGEEFLIAIPDA